MEELKHNLTQKSSVDLLMAVHCRCILSDAVSRPLDLRKMQTERRREWSWREKVELHGLAVVARARTTNNDRAISLP